ncbi:hypothetical protein PG623_07250 [Riemerella anatipestifer]|nr:hypothetical protein [Riemerella anatipestifer]
MKNKIILASLLVGSLAYGQIQLQNTPSTTIGDENPFLDASKFNNFDNNVGKGLYFPTTDLKTWEFKTNSINPGKFKNYFDGMIVYNTGEGTPTTEASKGGIRKNLTRGFYYFKNPNQTFPTGSVANGEWVKIGDSVSQDGQEWVYNPTNKRIELKRSGTAPFTNKVYYDENGGLKQLDFESYTDTTGLTEDYNSFYSVNYKKASNVSNLWRYSQNEPTTKTNMRGVFLVDKDETLTNFNINNYVTGTLIDKEYTGVLNTVSGLKAYVRNDAPGETSETTGFESFNILNQGSVNVLRSMHAINRIATAKNIGTILGYSTNNDIGGNGGSITQLIGARSYNTYRGSKTIGEDTGFDVGGQTLQDIGLFNIDKLIGFKYTGVGGFFTNNFKVKEHYGIYLNTINRGSDKNYAIYTNLGTVRFGDNVGIGVDTPTEKLEVAGRVKATSFAGTNGATLFPDYVFQKYYTGTSSLKADYSFKTLSQVEDFVKTNGHLPGYLSASKIKEQGYIDLMATQLTNVEKIEELYLHSIEQDKALKAKDAEIKELKERLSKIEALLSK